MHTMGEYSDPDPVRSPIVPAVRRLRIVAALGAVLSAGLIMLGSFQPLFVGTMPTFDQTATMKVTSWGLEVTEVEPLGGTPVIGYGLAVAAALMLGAALACMVAAMPASTPGAPRAACLVAMAAAAFLAGTVGQAVTYAMSLVRNFQPVVDVIADGQFGVGVGTGLWLLVAAVASALVTAVATVWSTRARYDQAADPYQSDVETPRHGIPVLSPVSYDPTPDERPDEP